VSLFNWLRTKKPGLDSTQQQRLEQLCKKLRGPGSEACTIILGDATRACLGDKFRLDDIGQAPLKGKAHLVQIYKLLGEK